MNVWIKLSFTGSRKFLNNFNIEEEYETYINTYSSPEDSLGILKVLHCKNKNKTTYLSCKYDAPILGLDLKFNLPKYINIATLEKDLNKEIDIFQIKQNLKGNNSYET